MTSAQVLQQLSEYESRNVTYIAEDGSWPIVWDRAKGVHVWDQEGKRYLDLTAAFGVAAAGHANPSVVRAGRRQMGRLLHAMGDVHPHALKAQLARELSRLTFERWAAGNGKVVLGNSGFEAVEAALKTAMLATGKPGVIAFWGGYHGLGYGALNATCRDHFRGPFRSQLREFGHFVSFPGVGQLLNPADRTDLTEITLTGHPMSPAAKCQSESQALAEIEREIEALFKTQDIGAILVEPIQARGGVHIPPPCFLPILRRLCDAHSALLILDEIYTGFGRTGAWFACEHWKTIPDLICLGKAMTGGFPLSACVGRASLMDAAWPATTGEAIHTSTFLGHPVGCAMSLAQLGEIERLKLVEQSATLGIALRELLLQMPLPPSLRGSVRGLGLMAGIELSDSHGAPAGGVVMGIVKQMLQQGFILLPEGDDGEVLSFTPPLTISKRQLDGVATALQQTFLANVEKG